MEHSALRAAWLTQSTTWTAKPIAQHRRWLRLLRGGGAVS
eukprot:CAMPEP_0169414542 /NCGR_PEP_ID=MMETSP1017-20121227/62004_1 /TAXON_ID=342587 /ORGANISM="Karlodinium micrum, Strain CCMP2283" /LENGTH=39 /DNA_ID= /DNA_START= /DNA_END= /DNA_ORIENTATION=